MEMEIEHDFNETKYSKLDSLQFGEILKITLDEMDATVHELEFCNRQQEILDKCEKQNNIMMPNHS